MRQIAVAVGDQLRLYDVDDSTGELSEVARARVSTTDAIHLARLAVSVLDLLTPPGTNGTTPERARRATPEPRRAPEPPPLPSGLGKRQRAILEALSRVPAANVAELGLMMPEISRAALSSCMTDLKRMGYVESRPGHRWARTARTEPLPGTKGRTRDHQAQTTHYEGSET